MNPFSIASLGLGFASSIPQWITGYKQNQKADEMSDNLVRPEFQIPESQTRSLKLAENLAEMDRLPGQGATEGRLDQTTANEIAMIERMGIGGPTSINAASRAYGNQQAQETNLGVKAAEFKVRNQMNLQTELGDQAQWENKQWDWNERLPYENKATAIQALREGGMRNKNSAWKNVFGSAASFFGGMAGEEGGMDWLGSLFGNNNNTTPTSNNGVNPAAPSAEITTNNPEQKRVMEMMWGF